MIKPRRITFIFLTKQRPLTKDDCGIQKEAIPMGEVVEQDVGIYLINSDIHFSVFMNTETQRHRVIYYLWSHQSLCLCVSVFYFVPARPLVACRSAQRDACQSKKARSYFLIITVSLSRNTFVTVSPTLLPRHRGRRHWHHRDR